MNVRGNATTSRVRVADRRTVETAIARAHLSHEEENVLRMRYGLTLAPEAALAFRDGASDELRARLALMELSAIEHLSAAEDARREAAEAEANAAATQAVIDRLRRL